MEELAKLGRYQLRQVLGKGAMGVVYDGFDPSINRRVAVKTILKSHAIDADTARDYSVRFVREAQAAGRINHPNIVQVYDFGEQEDVAYLVMEFIQGRELRSFFSARERFDVAESVRIMGELLDALDFAHEAGVIHRDVKPANVMLDTQRRVKLADFGVARIQDSERSAIDTMVGTPAYMSPEQISGKKIDRRTDIFSAGSILYQLLTGEQPFKGEGAWTVARQIMQDNPPSPSRVTVSVSPVFDAIVDKALAKDPVQRFSSAREFAVALRGALAGRTTPAAAASAAAATPAAKSDSRGSDAEVEFWRTIQNSEDPQEFAVYLEEYPAGTYAQLARLKIAKLKEGTAREAEEKRRQTQEAADLKRRAEAAVRAVSVPAERRPASPSFTLPAAAIAAVVAVGIGTYLFLGRKPAPVAEPAPVTKSEQPVPAAPAPPAPAAAAAAPVSEPSAADIERIRKETEARVRQEYASKSASEQAAAAKAAAAKAVQDMQATMRATAEKAAGDRAAAERAAAAATEQAAAARAAADKAAAEKAAAEKAAADRVAAERAAADKAQADKVAAEKAAAAKAAAERAAAEKAATARPVWPDVGNNQRGR